MAKNRCGPAAEMLLNECSRRAVARAAIARVMKL